MNPKRLGYRRLFTIGVPVLAAAVIIGWSALEIYQGAWEAAYVKRPWPRREPGPPKVWAKGEREKADAEIREAVLTWTSVGHRKAPWAVFEEDPSFAIDELARACRENKDNNGYEFVAPIAQELGWGEDGHMRPEVVEALMGFLGHDDRAIRNMAVRHLPRVDMADMSPEQRERVIETFRNRPSGDVARLVGRIGGEDALAALREHEERGRDRYDADFHMAYKVPKIWLYITSEERAQYRSQRGSSLHGGVRVALARLGRKQYEAEFIEAYKREQQYQIVKWDLIADLFYIDSPAAIEVLGDDVGVSVAAWGNASEPFQMPLSAAIMIGLSRRIPDFPVDYPDGSKREIRMCAKWWKKNKERVLKDVQAEWEKQVVVQ